MDNLLKTIYMTTEVFLIDINEKADSKLFEECRSFIIQEHKKMQPVVRIIISFMLRYLNIIQIFRYGSPFINLPIENRSKVIKSWSASIFPFKRDLIKLLQTLAILFFYDTGETLESYGVNVKDYLKILRFYNCRGARD